MPDDTPTPPPAVSQDSPSPLSPAAAPTMPVPQPINGQTSGLAPKKKGLKKVLLWIGLVLITILLAVGVAATLWYNAQLTPLSPDTQKLIPVTIVPGATSQDIGQLLQEKEVIRSATSFELYTRISGSKDKLQAGSYRLSPSESVADIVKHLVSGNVDQRDITFYPGATLKQHRQVLIDAGYSAAEVDEALNATYDSPLFADKPATADLEGYIYGQTYRFDSGDSVSAILQRTFDEFYATLTENNVIAGIEAQGYTLYQGIILASLVQKEVLSPASTEPSDDQRQVAQVFYSRLARGMTLGSDVTYQYAADKLGVERDVNLDSPYNTRRYAGLPPGPIASPGVNALIAVAAPAEGDYLYFLSGDDDITYFARTDAEHEANIVKYCQQKCLIL